MIEKKSSFELRISLKICYVSLKIYSFGGFDEIREECCWFQDSRSDICLIATLTSKMPVRCTEHQDLVCNAPDSMRQVSASYSPSLPCHLLACFILSCHHVHFILHTCSSHASEPFPRCPFCNPALLCPPAFPFCLSLWAGVKHSWNGPSLVKWPWYTTGRPPVKFRAIWRSFDTPTVNRVARNPPFSLQPNTSSHSPPNPANSPPCSRSFDHERVGENRSSFGLS